MVNVSVISGIIWAVLICILFNIPSYKGEQCWIFASFVRQSNISNVVKYLMPPSLRHESQFLLEHLPGLQNETYDYLAHKI